MSFVDLIGFIISIFALLFLFFRNWRDAPQGRNQTEAEDSIDVEDNELREFLRSLEGEPERPQAPPPASQKVQQKRSPPKQMQQTAKQTRQSQYTSVKERQLESELEDYRLQSRLEERRLQSRLEEYRLPSRLQNRRIKTSLTQEYSSVEQIQENRVPRIVAIMETLPSLQHMIVYHEVLGPPKSLRKWQQ